MKEQRLRISWTEIDEMVATLISRITAAKTPIANVYGIPRGGLVPAVMLSHRLDKPLILEQRAIGPETLLVDDLADSGATLERLSALTGARHSAVLYLAQESSFIPTFFARKKPNAWIIFPYETPGTSRYDYTV